VGQKLRPVFIETAKHGEGQDKYPVGVGGSGCQARPFEFILNEENGFSGTRGGSGES
jgi:hypothetical protein